MGEAGQGGKERKPSKNVSPGLIIPEPRVNYTPRQRNWAIVLPHQCLSTGHGEGGKFPGTSSPPGNHGGTYTQGHSSEGF